VVKLSSTEMPSTKRGLPSFNASVQCIATEPSGLSVSLITVPSPSMHTSTA